MKLLVTGGAGYIGSTLVDYLLKDHQVTVLDNLMYKQTSLLSYCHNPNFEFIYGDVRDKRLLQSLCQDAELVVPLSAIVGAPACDRQPELATQVNYEHVKHIAEVTNRVILPQTNSGYGAMSKGTEYVSEESPLLPVSLYGKTKCQAEEVVLNAGGISLRLATVFGASPRMRLDLLVNDFVYKALTDGYIVLFEPHFCRNYIHIRDVCRAFLYMIDNFEYCRGQAYNVGLSSANLSKYQLAMKVREHCPIFSVKVDDFRSDPDKRNYIVSNQKIEKLGFQPKYSLDHGIVELKKAYRMLFQNQQNFTNL